MFINYGPAKELLDAAKKLWSFPIFCGGSA